MRMLRYFFIAAVTLGFSSFAPGKTASPTDNEAPESLADDWELVGEAINEPGYDVWGSSPIRGADGRIHLFCARWTGKIPFNRAWRTHSELAHYVAEKPEGPFKFVEVVATRAESGWNSGGYHNPNIKKIGDRYALVFITNDKAKPHPASQAIGMLIADSLDGPWKAVPESGPLIAPPEDPDHWCFKSRNGVCNPALLAHPDGRYFIYLKVRPGAQGHSTMGVAIAKKLEGPYIIQPNHITANDKVIEDGYAFVWRKHICLLTTDNHGMLEEGGGLLWYSKDGVQFEDKPLAGFHNFAKHYFPRGVPKAAKKHYGKAKFERPQVLLENGEPAWLYVPSGVAMDGSDGTNCYVLKRKIDNTKGKPEK